MTGEGWAAVASLAAVLASIAAIAEHCVAMFKRKRREDAVADDKALVSVDGDDTAADQEPHDGETRRDTRKYAINGAGEYGKSRMVLEIIRRYVCEHPAVSYPQLEEVFPPALRGIKREGSHWGCFNRKEDAVALMNDTGRSRHFLNDADVIRLTDGTQIAVSSQWGVGNIHYFIDKASALGFDIREISVVKRVGALIGFIGICMTVMMSLADTEVVNGIEWSYKIDNGEVCVFGGGFSAYDPDRHTYYTDHAPAISPMIVGVIEVPSTLGGYPVTAIGDGAFHDCSHLSSVTIPSTVKRLGQSAFYGCSALETVIFSGGIKTTEYPGLGSKYWEAPPFYGCTSLKTVIFKDDVTEIGNGLLANCTALTSVVIPNGVEKIGDQTFFGCSSLVSITISPTVTYIGKEAFRGCVGLSEVTIPDSVRRMGSSVFAECTGLRQVDFIGMPPVGVSAPDEALIRYDAKDAEFWRYALYNSGVACRQAVLPETESDNVKYLGCVVVSNVLAHYVLNSVQPQFAISPSQDMGFVNIITEVKSTGVAAIPMSWAMNYPNFVSKFGSDFTAALGKPTGKIGTGGMPMLVWQDYVAGTDPTDEKDVFTASITIVDGKVTISYTPELDDARKAMRKYTTWGKTSLMDKNWTEVQDGHEAEYNFFKVSVEMR